MRWSTRPVRAGALVLVLAVLTACNPLEVHPRAFSGGGMGEAAVRYQGPAGSWVEVSITGTEGHAVYALALVQDVDRTGPTARPCATPTATAECLDTTYDLRMPSQVGAPTDGSWRPLMTVWPGEVVDVWLVCVEEATQELLCPETMRTTLRAVDATGTPAGDLTHALDAVAPPG